MSKNMNIQNFQEIRDALFLAMRYGIAGLIKFNANLLGSNKTVEMK